MSNQPGSAIFLYVFYLLLPRAFYLFLFLQVLLSPLHHQAFGFSFCCKILCSADCPSVVQGCTSAHGLFSSELGIRGPELTARKYGTIKGRGRLKLTAFLLFWILNPSPYSSPLVGEGRVMGLHKRIL